MLYSYATVLLSCSFSSYQDLQAGMECHINAQRIAEKGNGNCPVSHCMVTIAAVLRIYVRTWSLHFSYYGVWLVNPACNNWLVNGMLIKTEQNSHIFDKSRFSLCDLLSHSAVCSVLEPRCLFYGWWECVLTAVCVRAYVHVQVSKDAMRVFWTAVNLALTTVKRQHSTSPCWVTISSLCVEMSVEHAVTSSVDKGVYKEIHTFTKLW